MIFHNEEHRAPVLRRRVSSFFFFSLFIFIFFAVSFYPVRATALLQWAPTNGPWGGHITCIEFSDDGNTIYVGTWGGGVFRSEDGGNSWEWKAFGVSKSSLIIKDIETSGENIVFAVPNDSGRMESVGIYKSVNKGEAWNSKNNNLGDLFVNDIAVDKKNPTLVYAATESKGINKSTDEGESWAPSGLGSELSPVTCIAIATYESKPSIIYAGTDGYGVWKSSDEAASWTRVSSAMPGLDTLPTKSIAVAPSSPESLYVAITATGNAVRVYKSTDEGISWEAAFYPDINIENPFNIDVDPFSPEVVYITTAQGTFKSTDGATAPELISFGEMFQKDIAINPHDNSFVLSGNYGSGIFRSTNYGASFEVANAGLNNINVRALEIASVEGASHLYAAALADAGEMLGLYKSTDEGYTWNHIDSFDPTWEVKTIYSHPSSPEIVFVGVYNGPPCLFRSTDSGGAWGQVDVGSKNNLMDIAADPQNANILYCLTSSTSSGNPGNNVYKSTDFGENWVSFPGPSGGSNYATRFILAVKATLEADTMVFIAASGIGYNRLPGFWKITDEVGASWVDLRYVNPSTNITDYPWIYGFDASRSRESIYGYFRFPHGEIHRLSYYGTAGAWSSVIGNTIPYCNGGDFEIDQENPYVYYASARRSRLGFGHAFYSFDELRQPVKVAEEYGLPSLNTGFADIGGLPWVTRPRPSCWQVEIDPNSSKDSRVLFISLPGRSVWKAGSISQVLPPTPTNFSGAAKSVDSITWTWQDNSNVELGFRVYSSESVVRETGPNNVGTSVATIESGLETNKFYTRHVVSYNAEGESSSSNIGICYTLAETPEAPYLDGVGTEYISITWEANGNPSGTNYIIESSTAEEGSGLPIYWGDVGSSMLYPPSFDHMFLEPETVYYYRIRAENHDGIQTLPGEERWFKTATPEPSLDVVPPEITEVKFNDRPYFNVADGKGDIIYHTPRISAVITDYGSTEIVSVITPEGVDVSSAKIRFDTYLFDVSEGSFSLSSTESIPITPESDTTVVYMDFEVPGRLGDTTYICTIEARDRAIPWHNRGIWTGKVRVIGDEARVIGEVLCHPTPFKPLTDPNVIISYTLSTNADVTLYMYDISGQIILTKKFSSGLPGGQAGYNDFTWNGQTDFGSTAANGIFIIKVVSKSRAIGAGKLIVHD